MEVEASSNSSRRKSNPLKVKLSLGTKGDVKVNGDKKLKDMDSDANSDAESDSSDIPELPEGTVVVQPEPVEEEKIEFKGPEFESTKKSGGGTVSTNLDNLFCTACGRQINPWKTGMVKKHKVLRVITCRKCYIFVGSGKITQDEDGMDEQCRWCGEGGRLTVCDKCPRAFCKSCIMRNFGRAAFTAVTESETWDCYICNPEPLEELKKHTRHVFAAIKAVNGKKSKSSEPPATTDNNTKAPPSSSLSVKASKKESSANGEQNISNDMDEESVKKEKTKNRPKATVKKESGNSKKKTKDSEEEDSDVESKKTPKSKKRSKPQKAAEDSEEEDAEFEEKKAKSAIKKKAENGSSGGKTVKVEAIKDFDSSEEDEILDRDIDSLLEESESCPGQKTNEDDEDSDDEEEEKASTKREASKKKRKAGKVGKKGKKGSKKGDDSSEISEDNMQEDGDDDDMGGTAGVASKPKKRASRKKGKKAESDNEAADEMDEDREASGSESEAKAPKRGKGRKASTEQKKGKKSKKGAAEESDLEPEDGKRKRTRGKVSTEGMDSESDIEVKPKRRREKKKDSDEESFTGEKSSEEEDEEDGDEEDGDSTVDSDEVGGGDGDDDISDEPSGGKKKERGKGKKGRGKGKEKGKKRKRIKKTKGSSSEGELVEPVEEGEDPSSRKKIRKIKSDKKLGDTTKAAARAEEDRRQRVLEKQEKFNGVEQKEVGEGQALITTKLVLEQEEETKEPLIEVSSKLVRKLKPHQVEAVQFIWDCMFESVERAKKEEFSAGCILAHCMGLGKTLSVVAFVHTMMAYKELTGVKTCLVVSPLNTVLNWTNEFDIWLDEEDKLEVWEMASVKQNLQRSQVLDDWLKKGGIMIIGYEMLRNLSQGSRVRNKKQKAIFHKTLIDPGPDIVVCDEGHIMKNTNSALSKAMNQIKTRRRVVLTGTPLQNNLIEYHCMVDFVKPNLLGTKKEFANRFVNPITNGQHSDSTPRDVRIMKNRAHVLHELLAGSVQRRDYSALTKFLPPKQEYVISVRLSEMQIHLYEDYLKRGGQVDGQITTKGAQLFKDYQNLMKIWTHPWVLKLAEIRDENKMKYDDEDSIIDDEYSDEDRSFGSDDNSSSNESEHAKPALEEGSAGEGTSSGRRSRRLRNRDRSGDKDEIVRDWKTRSRGGEGDDSPMDTSTAPQAVSDEWWAEYVKEEDQNKMEHSGKLVLLFDILRMCEEIGDKVLIFSQSLLSLDIIEYFLEHVDSKFTAETQDKPDEEVKEEFGKRWTKGEDYFRLDGSTSAQLRQHWAIIFNDAENLRARLFLISTRAGGLGINLVGANRVIIFDASWNPSHDVQSIFRVYRFGQVKPCYIYRFMAQGTMEDKIYDRQVTKLSLSQRVVDEHQVERHFTAADLSELYAFKPVHLADKEEDKEILMLPKDVLLAEIMSGEQRDWFVALHEHDSLLENLVEQELTEEEKKAAWEEYENEKKGLRMNMNVSPMGQGSFGLGNYLSQEFLLQTARNLREQNPDMPQEVLQMHLQRIIMMQIRQRQEEQRRMELLQRQQFMQMQQHYAQLQQQYLQQMGQDGGGMFPSSMMHLAPGQRFSPSLYAHMAMPGLTAFHGGVAAAALNTGSGRSGSPGAGSSGESSGSSGKAGTSKEASSPSEVTDQDKQKD